MARFHTSARLRRRLATGLLVLLTSGFVTSCVGVRAKQSEAFDRFRAGAFDAAVAVFEDENHGSSFLAGAEAGTAALVAGDWETAVEHYGYAADFVREIERTALISPASVVETLLSWGFNDTATTYEGEGYERVMLHASQAIAFLALGRFESAQVELRLADQLLTSEEELYETKYSAGGLGHLLSGIAYEMQGKLDEAYIDYKRMADKGIAPELVGRTLVRLAEELHYPDANALRQEYGSAVDVSDDAATMIVVAGVGLGPFKSETSFSVPLDNGLFQFAVPEFRSRSQPVQGLRLEVPTADASVDTVIVEDVSSVAHENLSDRVALIAAKSAARGLGKRELTKELERAHGEWGRVLGDLYAFISERADLRSWMTLPDTWQASRLFLPAGEHDLYLAALGGESAWLGRFGLVPGETVFVFARTIDRQLFAHVVGGEALEGGFEEPALIDQVAPSARPNSAFGQDRPLRSDVGTLPNEETIWRFDPNK